MFKLSTIPQWMFRMISALNTMHTFILFKKRTIKKQQPFSTCCLKQTYFTSSVPSTPHALHVSLHRFLVGCCSAALFILSEDSAVK